MTPPTSAAELPVKATRADLAQNARKHYEFVATEACDWLSTIPECIDAWERQPELEAAAVAQRQRAEDAERDYAVLLADYNAAAAWLGVLESGDDLEVAAKSLTDQLSDVLQRADALQQQIADLTGAEFDHTVATAEHYLNIGQAERDELKARADAAEAELAEQHERGDKYSLGWINETKRADALAQQVERLTKALEQVEYTYDRDLDYWYCGWCETGKHLGHSSTCPRQLALHPPAPAPDPNASSLDDFTHWPFPPEG